MTTRPVRRKLTPALIKKAGRLASKGLPLQVVAVGVGVHPSTLSEWLNHPSDELEAQLGEAIRAGQAEGSEKLVDKLAAGDGRDAAWLLTHAPAWRDNWSDAAATRREVRKVLEAVVTVICQSGLTLDEQRDLLLDLQARGLNAEPPALPPGDG